MSWDVTSLAAVVISGWMVVNSFLWWLEHALVALPSNVFQSGVARASAPRLVHGYRTSMVAQRCYLGIYEYVARF